MKYIFPTLVFAAIVGLGWLIFGPLSLCVTVALGAIAAYHLLPNAPKPSDHPDHNAPAYAAEDTQ